MIKQLKYEKTIWNFLTFHQMQELFPEAMIIKEMKWGLTKSLIAINKI